MDASTAVQAVVERLRPSDVALLLSARGLPALPPGVRADAPPAAAAAAADAPSSRLTAALQAELCEWEWEAGEVGAYHAEIIGAGCTLVTHNNCILAYGGLDGERAEQAHLWRWDLAGESGFEPVAYRGAIPPRLTAGHVAAVHGDELWVFPGPRNADLRTVHVLDLLRFRWSERAVTGSPPADARQRRCLAALPDGRRLLVLGGPVTDTVHAFDYASRTWTVLAASGGPGGSDWQFGGALLRGRSVFMFGAAALPPAGREAPVELWELSLKTMAWTRVSTRGTPLPYRIHAAHAAVGPRWVVAGGRRPGRFNVTADAWEFDFDTMRWRVLMAEGTRPTPREWHAALGLQDCVVFVGGRTDIPEYEPVPVTADGMAAAVEILWVRPPPTPEAPTGQAALLAHAQSLCEADTLADVTLVAGGGEGPGGRARLPAHRALLAAHSPVFAAMFSAPMREGAPGATIAMPDVPPATARALLAYAHGALASLPPRHDDVVSLFKAADKYDLPGLAGECVEALRGSTGPGDVARLLAVAAERHNAALRDVCVCAAAARLPAVLASPSFAALVAVSPALGLGFVSDVVTRLGVAGEGGSGGGGDAAAAVAAWAGGSGCSASDGGGEDEEVEAPDTDDEEAGEAGPGVDGGEAGLVGVDGADGPAHPAADPASVPPLPMHRIPGAPGPSAVEVTPPASPRAGGSGASGGASPPAAPPTPGQ